MSTYCISCDKLLDIATDGANMCISCLKTEEMKNRINEPAFPINIGIAKAYGLTKREWFAGMALSGATVHAYNQTENDQAILAKIAFGIADAMIKTGKETE